MCTNVAHQMLSVILHDKLIQFTVLFLSHFCRPTNYAVKSFLRKKLRNVMNLALNAH